VTVDGASVVFQEDEPIRLHLEAQPAADASPGLPAQAATRSAWHAGPAHHDGPWKHGDVAGPLRDALRAPLLFVYGASDPLQTVANEEVARAYAAVGWAITVKFPVVSDVEFYARGESLARPLFLVGNARSNRVVRELEPGLPIVIDGDSVVVGRERLRGSQLGAAFVRPNPKSPDNYLVVVEGVDALGTLRSLSLPSLLPDFVVYDVNVAPARGQMLLGAGMVRAAGFFQNDWSLPPVIADPLATTKRPGAKSEYDATPYLP
jgi:hypothetical protein